MHLTSLRYARRVVSFTGVGIGEEVPPEGTVSGIPPTSRARGFRYLFPKFIEAK